MKEKKLKQKEKAKELCEKLIKKQELLNDIKKQQEKKRKKLENKIEKMTKKKELFDRKRELSYQQIRRSRNKLFEKTRENKKKLDKEEVLKRDDILFDENNRLGRFYNNMDISGKTEINNIQIKTLQLSKEDYELRKEFLKKMNKLKEESVSKKSLKERRKIYMDKVRAEAEKKRREEEERLEKLQMS